MTLAKSLALAGGATESIAPWWHTVLVLAFLATGSVASAYQHGLPNANLPGISSRLSSYFTVLAQEWFLVLLIWLVLKRRGLSMSSLVSGPWQTYRAFFRDLGLAVGFVVVAVLLLSILPYFLGAKEDSNLGNIMPKTGLELVTWVAMSATAGFCEELVFRGYLMQQFRAWTGSRVFSVVLQGVAFGLAHGYYAKTMVLIMVHGWLLGLLADWRKSLRPGMLAHALQDGIGGVVAFFFS